MIIQGTHAIALSGAFGQDTPALTPPASSYQDAFDAAFNACSEQIGSEECRRLLGFAPYVCPPPAQRPMYTHPLFWLFFGLLVSKVFL